MEAHRGPIADGQEAWERHPATPAQESLWFLDRTLQDRAIYNIPFARRLEGPLDVEALAQAFRMTVAQHNALTSRFIWDEVRGLFQETQPDRSPLLEVLDRRVAADPEIQAELHDLARHAFDLTCGPLIVAKLLVLGPGRHILAFCVHHIVFDAWSYQVFLDTWRAHYAGLCASEKPQAPAPALPFGRWAALEQARLTDSVLQPLERYWKQHLDGSPGLLTLPTDRPRQGALGAHAGMVRLHLQPDVLKGLTAFARGERGTLFMALMTAFQLLLSRLSGQDDVVVGSPVAGRSRQETWGTVGYFVNTLALRVKLSGNPTVRELFRRVRTTVLEGLAHQDLSFERLVRLVNPARTQDHTPLFQAMLVLHNVPKQDGSFAGLRETPLSVGTGATAFDLTLAWYGQEGMLEYRSDLFETATIQRFATQFQRVVEAMVRAPDQPIQSLPLMEPAEVEQEWSRGRGDSHPVPDEGVHAAFLRQASLRPDSRAASHGDRHLTYAQLDHLSGQVAAGLAAQGIRRGSAVGLLLHPGLEQLVAQLGILRAGAAYLPLDPEHPGERIRQMLTEAQAPLLLTHAPLQSRVAGLGARALSLDLEGLAKLAGVPPADAIHAEDLACILFTSGSTGRPKGVQVRHGGLVNILTGLEHTLRIGPGDRTLAMTALGFDPSSMERLLPLRCGGTVELLDRATVVDAFALKATLDRARPTLLVGTPALWQLLQQAGWVGDGHVKILCGGEALLAPVAEYLLAQAGEVWNQYGPTEATILSTCHRVEASDLRDIPIGRPVWNTHVLVLDDQLQPVPPGVTGEICIAGEGLALGYAQREAETRARFLEVPGLGRLYRTGDRGRWRSDGTLAYVGRSDHQVKLRGYRIELEEVEAAYRSHPSVLHAAADVREDPPRLVIFLVPQPGQSLDPLALQKHAKACLPAYMVPSQAFALQALPLRNDKLDRESLHAAPLPPPPGAPDRMAPRGPTESLLHQIWAELLGRDDFGITDDFFDLGGHSLLVMRLAARIEQVFGRRLPPAVLFQQATILHLGLTLRENAEQAEEQPWVQVQQGDPFRNIFYLHGDLPGLGLYSRALARHLDPSWSLTVIHPAGMAGQPLATDLRTMAADHSALIRRLQPEGPYRLAGYCNGAEEALEIATQLSRAGHTVERVVLVAPNAPRIEPTQPGPREAALEGGNDAIELALGALIRAVAAHVPTPYAGPVTFLLPDSPPPAEPTLGWDRLLPDLETRLVEGDHVSCLSSPTLGMRLAEAFGAAPVPVP